MNIVIKIVELEAEYRACLGIREKVFVLEQGVSKDLEIDEYESEAIHFLATADGQPIATGRMRVKGGFIKFERIATLLEYRKHGVGQKLVKEMEAFAIQKFPHLTPYLHAQLQSSGFYKKLGWKQKGESFFEAGIEHIAMSKPQP